MNCTEEQKAEMSRCAAERASEVWAIRMALRTNNVHAHMHPVNIKARHQRELTLVQEAVKAEQEEVERALGCKIWTP